jgi:hypothetical protein
VTWDNPDIWLETVGFGDKPSGTVVSSHELTADTDYFVIGRIWNGSVEAPAVNLPVDLCYLTFGIGTISTPIGVAHVDLPAKAVAGCPALATMKWHTPAAPGHYCLQVTLVWHDDAEPGNNLGQENTDVKVLNSPHAAFNFPVRNDTGLRRVLRLEADFYRISERPRCTPEQPPAAKPHLSAKEIALHRRMARAEHGRGAFPIPPGWSIKLLPDHLDLAPVNSKRSQWDVTAPNEFDGRQAINVNALSGEWLAGGLTLYVTSTP